MRFIEFQSTRPVRGATVASTRTGSTCYNFNPRAPCGARQPQILRFCIDAQISIHAPRVGRDAEGGKLPAFLLISIHAPRVGRDDARGHYRGKRSIFQSTRPVWGATKAAGCRWSSNKISIHAPRVGRDYLGRMVNCMFEISIHAPRVGRDFKFFPPFNQRSYFNPRAPCGARPETVALAGLNELNFNPRAPCGARHLPGHVV